MHLYIKYKNKVKKSDREKERGEQCLWVDVRVDNNILL